MAPSELFGIFIAAMIMVFLGSLVAFGIYLNRRRQQDADRAFQAAAHQLGFAFAPNRIWGTLQGIAVDARVEVRGGGKNRQHWTVVSARINPPLDLGLYVFRKGMLDDALGGILGAQDIQLGDPVFDGAFMVRGDEPSRVAALMNNQVRNGLRWLDTGSNRCAVTDAGATLERRELVRDPAWLVWAAQTVAAVALQLDQSRANVGAAANLRQHVPTWRAFAAEHGMSGQQTPLCMWGVVEGAQVWAYGTRRAARSHHLEVAVRFRSMLGIGLLVRPQRRLEGLFHWFGGQDLTLGDPAFDDRYFVQGSRAEVVARLLDEALRERVGALGERGIAVVLHDDGVVLRAANFPQNPEEALSLLQEARALASTVEENAGRATGVQQGPYR